MVSLAFLLVGYIWCIWYLNLSSPRGVADLHKNVLEIPIEVKEGFSVSNAFKLDSEITYWLRIECEKALPPKSMAEALANEFVGEFEITKNGVTIAKGHGYTSAFGGDYGVVRLADIIEGQTGAEYCLKFHVIRPSPTLATANPKLTISPNLASLKNMKIAVGLSKLKRVGVISVGISLLLSVAYIWLRMRRMSKCMP